MRWLSSADHEFQLIDILKRMETAVERRVRHQCLRPPPAWAGGSVGETVPAEVTGLPPHAKLTSMV